MNTTTPQTMLTQLKMVLDRLNSDNDQNRETFRLQQGEKRWVGSESNDLLHMAKQVLLAEYLTNIHDDWSIWLEQKPEKVSVAEFSWAFTRQIKRAMSCNHTNITNELLNHLEWVLKSGK